LKKQGLPSVPTPVATGFAKIIFTRFGLLRRKYLWGSFLFTKTLLFPNPVSKPGCYD
jgi:hypothetical protein